MATGTQTQLRSHVYREALEKIYAALEGESDPIVWMATIAAVLKEDLGYLWVGFYLAGDNELTIGPYQGSLACLRIPFDRGVCGACARRRQTVIVADVHEFEGHIACDSRSQSEIVVPVFDASNQLRAVLDVDSDRRGDFGAIDREPLEQLAAAMRDLSWSELS